MIAAMRRRGVLGINRRNADYTLAWNQRRCAQGHRWPVPFGTRHHHSPVGR